MTARHPHTGNAAPREVRAGILRGLVFAFAALLLGGCATTPSQPPPMATVQVQMVPATPGTSGAIFNAGRGFALFEDSKARDVGDLVTIQLAERTNATQRASTSSARESSTSIANPTLMGVQPTIDGRPMFETEIAGERSFDGSADTAQSNRLDGSITATVVARLPNGNLVVQGEKWIQLNQGDELVRIQGIVRVADIAPDNTIASSRVGEARISYSGRGTLARANARGWFDRFFDVVSPF
jgi:flagellar L-ring protein precursor FlgH